MKRFILGVVIIDVFIDYLLSSYRSKDAEIIFYVVHNNIPMFVSHHCLLISIHIYCFSPPWAYGSGGNHT